VYLKEAAQELVPAKYLEMKMKAFGLGYEHVEKKANLGVF
jgi:Pyruvate/2-oxoacid:ferredoxin oxidoreductase gamma subunit